MSSKTRLAKLFALSTQERRFLVQSFFWLAVMRAALWTLPFSWIVTGLGLDQGRNSDPLPPLGEAVVRRIAWAIGAASARVPWNCTCLVQALAALKLSRRQGLNSTLFLGVASEVSEGRKLTAHAWLDCGGHILTGAAGREDFQVISAFTTLRSGS